MFEIKRDELVKQKGKINLNLNINDIINKLNINKILDLIAELFLEIIESSEKINE